jgi:hypothetical protein
MKTAYELAMERLSKAAPSVSLTQRQKEAIAELESKYKARLAQREIVLRGEIDGATAAGDLQAIEQLEKRLASDRKSIQTELEEKKAAVRESP